MIQIRNLKIGDGIPKICVSIIEEDEQSIIKSAKNIVNHPVDIIEWRMDFFEHSEKSETCRVILKKLRDIVKERLILCTFRTKNEGGQKEVSFETYKKIILGAAGTGYPDLIDVEVFFNQTDSKELLKQIQDTGTKIIASYHDFQKTPEESEIIKRILFMKEIGADIAKLAVMPLDREDVRILLNATYEAEKRLKDTPVITMAMGQLGYISRLSGGIFGSSVTFGYIGTASAPGQIEVNVLKSILDMMY